jgi:hypothetical protein
MEQTLVSTQEVNVNLQILLERAVLSQKKVDTDTMQRVRQFQGDLSKVIKKKGKFQPKKLISLFFYLLKSMGLVHTDS